MRGVQVYEGTIMRMFIDYLMSKFVAQDLGGEAVSLINYEGS